ncbi:hypothetical protein [Streptomyces sp. NPDC085596]|uniref:hypothetical protein n=1 Tax=Streptomyces sp. NPDC085596 TaxID=3365731 RepID=UPI0037D2C615
MPESMADRMTASTLTRGHEQLARDARDLADALTRFADNIDEGLRCGDITRIAGDTQQLLIRAVQLNATRETASLYSAERDQNV